MKPFSLRMSPKPFKTFFQPAPLLLSGGRLSRKNKDPNVKQIPKDKRIKKIPRQPTIWATRPPLSGAAMGANECNYFGELSPMIEVGCNGAGEDDTSGSSNPFKKAEKSKNPD